MNLTHLRPTKMIDLTDQMLMLSQVLLCSLYCRKECGSSEDANSQKMVKSSQFLLRTDRAVHITVFYVCLAILLSIISFILHPLLQLVAVCAKCCLGDLGERSKVMNILCVSITQLFHVYFHK
jgi:hypothetical protein